LNDLAAPRALGMEVTLASVAEERKVCRGVLCEPAKSLADIQRLLCETAPDLLVSVGDPRAPRDAPSGAAAAAAVSAAAAAADSALPSARISPWPPPPTS